MLLQTVVKILTPALLAASLIAQNSDIRGPVSGLVYDGAARAVRPVIGVPGAAYLGHSLLSEIDFAAVSPDGEAVIALSAGRLFLVRNLADTPRWTILEDHSSATRAAWSEDSASAAVYSSEAGVRRFDGLKRVSSASNTRPSPRGKARTVRPGVQGLPKIAGIGSAPDGEISVMAIDACGDVIIGAGDTFHLGSPGKGFRLIAKVERAGGLALAGDRLFIADRARGEILEVRNYHQTADVQLFAGADRGVADPVAMAVSADRRSLIVASASGRTLQWFDLDSRASTARIDLDFEPSQLVVCNGGAIFWLNSRGAAEEPLQILADRQNPAVFFVPAGKTAGPSQASRVEE